MVADLRIPPQATSPTGTVQAGSVSPARTRAWTGSAGWRSPQRRHVTSEAVPWISTIRAWVGAGLLVQPVDVLGDQHVETTGTLELDQGAVSGVGLRVPHR